MLQVIGRVICLLQIRSKLRGGSSCLSYSHKDADALRTVCQPYSASVCTGVIGSYEGFVLWPLLHMLHWTEFLSFLQELGFKNSCYAHAAFS